MTDALAAIDPSPAPEAPAAPAPPEERPVFAAEDAPRRDIPASTEVWRRDPGRTSSPMRVLLLTQLLVCLAAGVIIGLVSLPRSPVDPLFVSVPVGEYEDPAWPVNPWANRDTDLLADRFGESGIKAFGFQGRDRFRELLAWIGGESGASGLPTVDRQRPVVLHICALAAVRGRAVYILPADARPEAPAGWVNVTEVLKAAATRGSPPFLILDIARPAADPFGGTLGDDVSAVLHDVLTASRPAFPVLTACGPNETSLAADAASASAFALYLAQGLGGAADGFEDPNGPDREVTVRELARFVATRVDHWARRTHGLRQTPTLYTPDGREGDFVLARQPAWRVPEPGPVPGYPSWLRDAGTERDSLRLSAAARRDPIAFARLTAGLLSAEQRWLRPGTATRAEDAWRVARDEWGRATGRVPQPADWTKLPAAADRLAVARFGVPDPLPEVSKALTTYLLAKPEQEAESLTAWGAAAGPHRVAAVGLVWALAADTAAPTAEMVGRWARAADAVDRVLPLAETRVLRDLAARDSFRRQKLAVYPATAVAALCRAEDELGRLVALGPDQFHAIADAAASAAGDLRAGADRLLTASTTSQADEAVLLLRRAADAFSRGRDRLGRVRAARSALDVAALVLGESLTAATEFDAPSSAAWFAVADTVTRVATAGTENVTPTDVAALVEVTDRLVAGYGPAPVLRVTAPDRRTDPRSTAVLRPLATGAGLGGSGRVRVWDALLADTFRLHGTALEQEADPPPPVPPAAPATGRKVRRAEASVRLLRLAGAPSADEADGLLRKALGAGRAEDADRAWDELGTRLRTAWSKDLPERVRAGGPAAERVARAAPPAAARYRPWADLPAAHRSDSHAAYRTWIEGLPSRTVEKDSR